MCTHAQTHTRTCTHINICLQRPCAVLNVGQEGLGMGRSLNAQLRFRETSEIREREMKVEVFRRPKLVHFRMRQPIQSKMLTCNAHRSLGKDSFKSEPRRSRG